MAVTIRDLAQALHLSITQVSRALGGYHDVSEVTRAKVIQTAHEMGYEPSYAARQLRRKRADAIGFILPTRSPRFSDSFYATFLTGLCDEAAEHQVDLVVTSCPPDSELEKEMYQRWFQSRRVDGMIINRVRVHDWRVEYLAARQLPFVTLGLPEGANSFPAIRVNEASGFKRMVRHLWELGHRQIAYIGGPADLVIQQERYAGYREGLEDVGLRFDPERVWETELTEEGGRLVAQSIFSGAQHPTAVVCCNDQIAIGVLCAAKERGIKVGKEFSIAGYDGIRETELTDPPLTTIYQPTYEIGRQLVHLLVSVIDHQVLDQNLIMIEPSIIYRASTEAV